MASSSKKKTTMAKLNREARLRERRVIKKAKKDARKLASSEGRVDSPEEDAFDAPADGVEQPPAEQSPEQTALDRA